MQRIYICLVSDQPIPNMIPAFMKKFYPDKVILLQTPEKKDHAQRLKDIFGRHNIDVLIKPLRNSIAFYCMRCIIEQIIFTYNSDEIILNVTGGTKIMALGAYAAFLNSRKKKHRILYVNTAEEMILQIKPKIEMYEFEDTISVEDYLYSYGYKIESNRNTDYVMKCGKIIYDNKDYIFRNKSSDLISLRALSILRDNNFVDFKGGYWLEYYTYYCVNKYIKDESRLKCGVTVISPNSVRNELDVVFTFQNKIYIIECKTGLGGISGSVKLDVVGRLIGGVFAQLMMVRVGEGVDSNFREMYGVNVKLVNSEKLKDLDDVILQWIKG